MTTTTDRANLALAACEGLTDAELNQRGAGGFKAMIERKRMYSTKARLIAKAALTLDLKVKLQDKKIAELHARLAELQAKYEAALNLDAPVENTDLAASLLANLGKKDAE